MNFKIRNMKSKIHAMRRNRLAGILRSAVRTAWWMKAVFYDKAGFGNRTFREHYAGYIYEIRVNPWLKNAKNC